MLTYTRCMDSALCVPLMIDAVAFCHYFAARNVSAVDAARGLSYLFKVFLNSSHQPIFPHLSHPILPTSHPHHSLTTQLTHPLISLTFLSQAQRGRRCGRLRPALRPAAWRGVASPGYSICGPPSGRRGVATSGDAGGGVPAAEGSEAAEVV